MIPHMVEVVYIRKHIDYTVNPVKVEIIESVRKFPCPQRCSGCEYLEECEVRRSAIEKVRT